MMARVGVKKNRGAWSILPPLTRVLCECGCAHRGYRLVSLSLSQKARAFASRVSRERERRRLDAPWRDEGGRSLASKRGFLSREREREIREKEDLPREVPQRVAGCLGGRVRRRAESREFGLEVVPQVQVGRRVACAQRTVLAICASSFACISVDGELPNALESAGNGFPSKTLEIVPHAQTPVSRNHSRFQNSARRNAPNRDPIERRASPMRSQ